MVAPPAQTHCSTWVPTDSESHTGNKPHLSPEVQTVSGYTRRAGDTRVLEPQNVTGLSHQPFQFGHRALFSPGHEIKLPGWEAVLWQFLQPLPEGPPGRGELPAPQEAPGPSLSEAVTKLMGDAKASLHLPSESPLKHFF